ncbi:MAG TPA: hypothetical protein VED41_07515 [Solirubrobacteraceae bacterium]|nr:hypothetical protein [Solirubrobacteraceae bacterium]
MGSAFYGMPSRLPGIALGLPLLLDLERAAATLAALAAVSIFAWFTSRGYLPTVMGNILGYEVDRQHKLEQEVAQLDRRSELRIDRLEDSAHEYDNLLSKMGQEMLELRRRMGLLDGNPEP